MHIRNIFKDAPPNFQQLATEYPEFRPYVKSGATGKAYVNFKDPAALRALSTVILKKFFDISIDIPLDRLIPTIPLRLNYIHWIEDLLKDETESGNSIQGIDVGCGASCVYALLGQKMNGWKFTCTEIDEESFRYAKTNVEQNQADDKIRVILSRTDGHIFQHLFKITTNKTPNAPEETPISFNFSMCNPPFFSETYENKDNENDVDNQDIGHQSTNRTGHRPLPPAVNTASDKESFTQGGEVAFVKNMIRESVVLKEKIRWYTTMLGKKSSIKSLTKFLKELNVMHYTTTEFKQGRTMRWGLAWTFMEVKTTFPKALPKQKKTKPFYLNLTTNFFAEHSISTIIPNMKPDAVATILLDVVKAVENEFNNLELQIHEPERVSIRNKDAYEITGKAFRNTWVHHRLKRRKQQQKQHSQQLSSSPPQEQQDNQQLQQQSESQQYVQQVGQQSRDTVNFVEKSETKVEDTEKSGGNSDHVQFKRKTIIDEQKTCKRAKLDSENNSSKSFQKDIFTFSCTVGVGQQFSLDSCFDSPVLSLICLEGNREQFYQMVTYLKNVFHCLQISVKK